MLMWLPIMVSAQNTKLEVQIKATGGQINDTLDDETVVTLDLSSDDAEQENDEVDTPYDDDLDAGWEGAPDDQNILTLGLRFRDITIPRAARIWRGQGIAPGTGASSRFPVSRRRRDSRKTAMQARLPKPWRRSCNAPVIPSTAHVVASFARRNRPQRSSAVQWPTVAAG